MQEQLLLVKLNEEQIKKAKEVNGPRSKITHALLCGESGQMFGTEKQCMKYFSAWREIFPHLFKTAKIVDYYPVNDFKSTFNLVNILIEKHDRL
jgi:hypothetical protein